jgi:hypothetical protein
MIEITLHQIDEAVAIDFMLSDGGQNVNKVAPQCNCA